MANYSGNVVTGSFVLCKSTCSVLSFGRISLGAQMSCSDYIYIYIRIAHDLWCAPTAFRISVSSDVIVQDDETVFYVIFRFRCSRDKIRY